MRPLRTLPLLPLVAGLLLLPLAHAQATVLDLSSEPPLDNPEDVAAGGLNLWQIYNDIAGSTVVSSNAELGPTRADDNFYVRDFETTGTGSNRVFIPYARNAGFNNTAGFYTDPGVGNDRMGQMVGSGQGLLDDMGVFEAIMLPDDDLGFYLDTPAGLWYSESDLDDPSSGFEHMAAYSFDSDVSILVEFANGAEGEIGAALLVLTDVLMLAWEDQRPEDVDSDYQDFVGVFGTVVVPEPATALQLSLGLLGLAWSRRRKQVR